MIRHHPPISDPSRVCSLPSVRSASRGSGLAGAVVLVVFCGVALLGLVALDTSGRNRYAEQFTRERLADLHLAVVGVEASGKTSGEASGKTSVASLPKFLREDQLLAHAEQTLRSFSDLQIPPDRLRDAWGLPLLIVPGDDARLGLSPDRSAYVVSAGPDRRFLSPRPDNLYSYDLQTLAIESQRPQKVRPPSVGQNE
jgi:hypothetical protein